MRRLEEVQNLRNVVDRKGGPSHRPPTLVGYKSEPKPEGKDAP